MQILIIPIMIVILASLIVFPTQKSLEKLFFNNNIIFNASFDSIQVNDLKLNRPATVFMIIDDVNVNIPTVDQIKKLHNGNDKPTKGLIQHFINESLSFPIIDLNCSTEYHIFYAAISDEDQMPTDINNVVIKTLEKPKFTEQSMRFSSNLSVLFYVPLVLLGFTLFITKVIYNHEPLIDQNNNSNSVSQNSSTFDRDHIENNLLAPYPISIVNSTTEKLLVRAKVKALMLERSELEDRKICGICCYNSKNMIFLQCGHIFCCSKCASNLVKCPLDNQTISWKLMYDRIDYIGQKDQDMMLNPDARSGRKQLTEGDSDENWLKLYENLSYDIKKLKKNEFCGICFRRPREYLFLECGHVFCCSICAKDNIKCPLDQKTITKKIKLFYT